jgi:molybdopterin synthase catalytic subunit
MEPYGITDAAIDLSALIEFVSDPAAGAITTFLGTSRESSADATNVERPVETLWYEAYDSMATKRLRAIGEAARQRHGACRVACWHRTGEVAIGQASVAIAVSAPHRGEAFACCREVIDEIKRSVPIWKRERFTDGEEWVEGYHGDAADGGHGESGGAAAG